MARASEDNLARGDADGIGTFVADTRYWSVENAVITTPSKVLITPMSATGGPTLTTRASKDTQECSEPYRRRAAQRQTRRSRDGCLLQLEIAAKPSLFRLRLSWTSEATRQAPTCLHRESLNLPKPSRAGNIELTTLGIHLSAVDSPEPRLQEKQPMAQQTGLVKFDAQSAKPGRRTEQPNQWVAANDCGTSPKAQ
jgi:hypothetical protein